MTARNDHRAEVRKQLIEITPTLGIRERDAIMALFDSERQRLVRELRENGPEKMEQSKNEADIEWWYAEGNNQAITIFNALLDKVEGAGL